MWKILLLVGVVLLLTACEEGPTSVQMFAGGNTINNYSVNITNNYTTNVTNNITNSIYYNQTYNRSTACTNKNSYIYNITETDGVWTSLCDADDTGSAGGAVDYSILVDGVKNVTNAPWLNYSQFIAHNTSYYSYFYDIFSANTALTALGQRIDNLNQTKANQTDWIAQNTSTWSEINGKGISNLTFAQVEGELSNAAGWINNTLNISTGLALVQIRNDSGGQTGLELVGTSVRVLYQETDSDDWSMLNSGGQFYFKQETANSGTFNVRGNANIDKFSVNLQTNTTTINNTLYITPTTFTLTCTTARAGQVVFNKTVWKHYGCNGSQWMPLY